MTEKANWVNMTLDEMQARSEAYFGLIESLSVIARKVILISKMLQESQGDKAAMDFGEGFIEGIDGIIANTPIFPYSPTSRMAASLTSLEPGHGRFYIEGWKTSLAIRSRLDVLHSKLDSEPVATSLEKIKLMVMVGVDD